MDGTVSSYKYAAGERRSEIVSGKTFSVNHKQSYTNRPRSPDPPAVAPRLSQSRRSTSSAGIPWGFSDAEMKRKKRIAKYKVYTVEGNVKASLSKGFGWIKKKCSEIIHGY